MSNKIPCGGFELGDSLEVKDGKLGIAPGSVATSWNDLTDKPFYEQDGMLALRFVKNFYSGNYIDNESLARTFRSIVETYSNILVRVKKYLQAIF